MSDRAGGPASRVAGQVGRVVAGFRERTGRDPDGVWAAPGRVNLIGEHTDYNDGFVLPAAIDRQVVAAAGRRDGGRLRVWSLQEGPPADLELAGIGPGRVEGWAAYPAGVAWALGQAGVEVGGVDLVVDGDVPGGAGLSSSAALDDNPAPAGTSPSTTRSAPPTSTPACPSAHATPAG